MSTILKLVIWGLFQSNDNFRQIIFTKYCRENKAIPRPRQVNRFHEIFLC